MYYNFESINAVSFDKGCYIGQENTARQKYRGNKKYALQTIEILKGPIPKLNEDIFYNKTKIGTMKSRLDNLCLCLIRNDTNKQNAKEISTDHGMVFKIL